MKLDEYQDNTDVLTNVVEGNLEAGINPEKVGMIYRMLYEYANPIGSAVREVVSNCIDSHDEARDYRDLSIDELVKAGYEKNYYVTKIKEALKSHQNGRTYESFDELPNHEEIEKGIKEQWINRLRKMKRLFSDWEDRDVRVEFIDPDYVNETPRMIRYTDYGVGISPDRMTKIIRFFGASTKSHSERQIGAFGLGFKSPLGYTNMFIVRTRWNGIEYTYAVHRTESIPRFPLLSEEETDLPNGTTIEFAIKDGDSEKFEEAIKNQLAYFDGISYVNIPSLTQGVIYEGKNFLYRQNSPFSTVHLCIGKVYYPLNLQLTGVIKSWEDPPNTPIAIKINVDEVTGPDPKEDRVSIVWNRESIQYNSETTKFLKKKYDEVVKELTELDNKHRRDISSLEEFLTLLDNPSGRDLQIADEVSIPNIDSILGQREDPIYPKYEALEKLPLFDIFYTWDCVKKVQHGRRLKLQRLPTIKSLLSGNISYDRVYTLSNHSNYSSKVDQYLDWNGINIFYLIKRRKFEEKDHWLHFGYGRNDPTNDERILIESFLQEVDNFIYDRFSEYSEIEPSEAFLEMKEDEKRREREAKKTKIKRGEYEFPVKHLRFNHSPKPYEDRLAWKMDDMDQADAGEKTALMIYGFQADDDLLISIAPILFSNSNFCERYGSFLDPKKAMLLKISMANEKFFEDNPNAMHVKSFCKDNHRAIMRYLTAYRIHKNLDMDLHVKKLIDPTIKEADLRIYKAAVFIDKYISTYYANHDILPDFNEKLLRFFVSKELERRKLISKNRKLQAKVKEKFGDTYDTKREKLLRKYSSPQDEPLFDDYAIERFNIIAKCIKAYPLLFHVNFSYVSAEEIKEYLLLGRKKYKSLS